MSQSLLAMPIVVFNTVLLQRLNYYDRQELAGMGMCKSGVWISIFSLFFLGGGSDRTIKEASRNSSTTDKRLRNSLCVVSVIAALRGSLVPCVR